jgi:adenylylsulfate kinase
MADEFTTNIFWHQGHITQANRESLSGHRGVTVWMTGLAASGKSTLAVALEEALFERECHTYILDGDNIRHGLCRDLGFSPADRMENIRRIGEVARLFTDAGVINIVAFISPYRRDRDGARNRAAPGAFIEIFVDCPLSVCESRDPKGTYQKARRGEIPEFTGIDAPYEPPRAPEIHLRTDRVSVDACVREILGYLRKGGYIPAV